MLKNYRLKSKVNYTLQAIKVVKDYFPLKDSKEAKEIGYGQKPLIADLADDVEKSFVKDLAEVHCELYEEQEKSLFLITLQKEPEKGLVNPLTNETRVVTDERCIYVIGSMDIEKEYPEFIDMMRKETTNISFTVEPNKDKKRLRVAISAPIKHNTINDIVELSKMVAWVNRKFVEFCELKQNIHGFVLDLKKFQDE